MTLQNFAKVNDLLYRSAAPAISDIPKLKKFGIKKIVSLDESAGNKIDRATKLLGLEHIMQPIEINKRGSLLKFLCKDLFSLLNENGPVLVHCAAGKDRSGLACAMFRCRYQNWPCDKALKEAKSFGFGIGLDPKIIRLYIRLIHNSCEHHDHDQTKDSPEDVNASDDKSVMQYQSITQNQRDYPSDYRDYTLDQWEQQSWSPYADYNVREFPYAPTDLNAYPEQYDSRLTHDLDDSDALKGRDHPMTFPQVGQYDNATNGINGAGPSMLFSGFE